MQPQAYEWTCSVASVTWVLQSMQAAYVDVDQYTAREQVLNTLGYPQCVNEVYGAMSSTCLQEGLSQYGLDSQQAWVTFDQAYAICSGTTGLINPVGMYHYMAIRGVSGDSLWVANSAPGYYGVGDTLSRSQFNALSPVQIVAIRP
jgi:hypothetical protein